MEKGVNFTVSISFRLVLDRPNLILLININRRMFLDSFRFFVDATTFSKFTINVPIRIGEEEDRRRGGRQ